MDLALRAILAVGIHAPGRKQRILTASFRAGATIIYLVAPSIDELGANCRCRPRHIERAVVVHGFAIVGMGLAIAGFG